MHAIDSINIGYIYFNLYLVAFMGAMIASRAGIGREFSYIPKTYLLLGSDACNRWRAVVKIFQRKTWLLGVMLLTCSGDSFADGWNPYTKAPNNNSVANTRHNLTQSWADHGWFMDGSRNDYGEVCVYCHTPHGANRQYGAAPLWNRTLSSATYTLYSKMTSLNQPITAPGLNSLTCLSCHDGTVAIDSVINMPKSNGYSVAQETGVSQDFLDGWSGPGPTGTHGVIYGGSSGDCSDCHHDGYIFPNMDSFKVFNIGTDLSNDHPIGVLYPTSYESWVDFKQPDVTLPSSGIQFFDTNGDTRADKNEIRLYDTGDGFEVECSSCHDPHGVPSSGAGSEFIPSFLRVSNINSNLCQTCHTK